MMLSKSIYATPTRRTSKPRFPWWLIVTGLLLCPIVRGDESSRDFAPRWWKGNIHTHSLWSDGNDFPEMIADWYRRHEYHFLALSDHNILSQGQRWMKLTDIEKRGAEKALEKYTARFGEHWVEQRLRSGTDEVEVRLKPLHEFRCLLEERGRFLMIPGEEISDSVDRKPVHMNATNLRDLLPPVGGQTVREAIRNNLRAAAEQAERSGREILVHLNHPNFGWAVTAEDLAHVIEEEFFEVYNGHPVVRHRGDATHPSVERLWDIANTIRIAHLDAAPLRGVATDDSHNYHGKPHSAQPGRGWIMVRARYLTPEHLIRAMRAGDFYASSGVTLKDVAFDAPAQTIRLRIQAEEQVRYRTQFIGTRRSAVKRLPAEPVAASSSDGAGNGAAHVDPDEIGVVLAESTELEPSYTLRGDELYVRAVVTADRPHPNPSFQGQMIQAWCQPVTAKD